MSSIYSNVNSTNTILGLMNQLAVQLDSSDAQGNYRHIDLNHTINAKRNVFPAIAPNADTRPIAMRYFGVGIRGAYGTFLTQSDIALGKVAPSTPFIPSARNMDIYSPIPIRVIHEDDLENHDLGKYRMRTRWPDPVTGEFIQFWLKLIDDVDEATITAEAVDASGNKVPFVFNPLGDENTVGDLTPEPDMNTDFTLIQRANVSVEARCIVSGEEIAEAIEYMYNGDTTKAQISEIGFYTGGEYTVPGDGHIEAVGTQLAIHRCMGVMDLSNIGTVLEIPMVLTNGSSMLAGSYI